MHDVTTLEGDGFTAKVHHDETEWHAQVRIQDDQGIRGRVLNFVAPDSASLANRIGWLASELTSVQNKILELGGADVPA